MSEQIPLSCILAAAVESLVASEVIEVAEVAIEPGFGNDSAVVVCGWCCRVSLREVVDTPESVIKLLELASILLLSFPFAF